MGANDPIGSVGVGLGHKPNPSALVFNGTGGKAVVYHDPSDYASLMVLCGHILSEWSVVYPPGAAERVLTFGREKLKNCAGSTSVTFSGVQVLDVRHVFGAVEVTLQYHSFFNSGPFKGMARTLPGGDSAYSPWPVKHVLPS